MYSSPDRRYHRALVLAIRQSIIELKRQSDLTQSDVQVTRHHAEVTLSEMYRHRADVETHQKKELREKLIKWLSVTDPSSNYFAARKKHKSSTGEWLLRHRNLEMWKTSQNTLLWLSGIRESTWFIYSHASISPHVLGWFTACWMSRLFIIGSAASAYADRCQRAVARLFSGASSHHLSNFPAVGPDFYKLDCGPTHGFSL